MPSCGCGPSPHTWGLHLVLSLDLSLLRSIPTYVGFTNSAGASCTQGSVHPHIRGVYYGGLDLSTTTDGPSPHTWGLRLVEDRPEDLHRSIPTYVGFTTSPSSTRPGRTVHPHIRGVYTAAAVASYVLAGPSPHTWGLRKGAPVGRIAERSIPTYVGFTEPSRGQARPDTVHPHIRGVYTEIKSKISRASSKTALLPAEKFKILFLVKIKSSAAAFQVHTIFRDQFPPGLHFEIALHL